MNNPIAEEIRQRGWSVVPAVLSQADCEEFIELLRAAHSRYVGRYVHTEAMERVHGSGHVKLVYNLHNKHEKFLSLIFHEIVTEVAGLLLSEGSYKDSEPFQVALTQARCLVGPQAAQQLHIDSYLPGLDRVLVLQAAWALSDFTPGSGSTCLVEGSHTVGRFAEDGVSYDSLELEAPAGSLILFNGGVWHGSSPKSDDGERWAIFNRYTRWFMRPSFDHSKNTPEHIIKSLSDEQKRMLGLHFCSPRDEFTRVTRISPEAEYDRDYRLP